MMPRLLHLLLLTSSVALADEAPVAQRIAGRQFPSIFQAWNAAAPLPGHDVEEMTALHDLVFVHPSALGLESQEKFEGTAFTFTSANLDAAKARRHRLLVRNPHLKLLAEIRYRDAPKGFIPEDASWWKRDTNGNFIIGWPEGGYRLLDVAQEDWQAQVARRAKAVLESGVFDGVMLDWWTDDEAHLSLIRRVREAIGPDALVLVNSNDSPIPKTAEYVNGLFMECYRSKTTDDWKRISETLRWAESHLRAPRINCVETWFHQSRQDLSLMRAVTTLALTQSDGYCLFSDPNELPTADHLHDWYEFWSKGLGQPKKPGVQRADGAWERDFANGTVIYNPAGGSRITVRFEEPLRSRATGRFSTEHHVAATDGDIFIGNE